MSLSEGTTIADRYVIVRLLGSGGMGFVYEVTHIATGHRFALKTIKNDDSQSSPTLIRQLLDESKATARIKSEHIVKVTDGGVDATSKLPFLVMELLEGTSVAAELARRGRLPAVEVLELLYQASLALEKTHAAGVVHRDLKPENLFLTTRDDGSCSLKILDFGIAKVVDSSTNPGTTRNLGTPLYMSPEQYRGAGDIDHRADLYSLAHIAFALLTGRAYWDVESRSGAYALMWMVIAGARETASCRAQRMGTALPASFDRWFGKATAIDAHQRFDSVTDMVVALGEALGLRVPHARAARPPRPPAPSTRWKLIAGIAALGLGAAGVTEALLAPAAARPPPAAKAAIALPRHDLSVAGPTRVATFDRPPVPPEAPRERVERPKPEKPEPAKKTSDKKAVSAVTARGIEQW